MMSNDSGDKPQNTTNDKSGDPQSRTRQSAQARARNAKKNVTIDLEAKDVTAKPETSDKKPASAAKAEMKTDTASTKAAATAKTTKPAAQPKVIGSTPPKSTATPKTNEKKPSSEEKGAPNKNASASKTKTATQKPQAKKSGGFMGALLSAIIGGIIAVLGFLGLQISGALPFINVASDGSDIVALEQRIAIIENLPVPEGVKPSDIEDLEKRIASVETIADKSVASEETNARLVALETRLSQMESQIETLSTVGARTGEEADAGEQVDGAAVVVAAPAGLADRLSAIEARLNALNLKDNSSDLDSLKEQMAGLDLQITELGKTTAPGAEQSVSAETTQILGDLSAELATLKLSFEALKKQDGDFVSELAALEKVVEETQEAIKGQSGAGNVLREVAQAVALDNLKKVAQSGVPFGDAFAALQKTGFPAEKITLIEAYADKGLPNDNALKLKLEELIGTALVHGKPAPENAEPPQSALDKLLSNARSVIKIRKTGGETPADDSPLTKMREAFAAGNSGAFLESVNKLDEEQKALFGTWLSDWNAVMSLDALQLAPKEDEITPPPTGIKQPASTDNTAQ